MNKLDITNQRLYNYHIELLQMRGSIVSVLLSSQIKYLEKHNMGKIQELVKRISDLQHEYFEFNEKGEIIQEQVDEKSQPTPKMRPFKLLVSFNEMYNAIMAEPATFNVI